MNSISVPLDYHSFIGANSSYNIINWSSNPLCSQSLCCCLISRLLLKDFPQEPAGRNSVIFNDTDKIVLEALGSPRINVDRKSSKAYSCQSEYTAYNCVHCEQLLSVLVVLHVDEQLGEELPHLEVEISTMNYLPVLCPHEEASAGGEGGELVHEIEEEDFLEGVPAQLRECIYFSNKILVFELIASVPLHSIIKALWNRQQIQIFHKSSDWFLEISGQRGPSNFWGIVEGNFVYEWNSGLYRSYVRNHRRQRDGSKNKEKRLFQHLQDLLSAQAYYSNKSKFNHSLLSLQAIITRAIRCFQTIGQINKTNIDLIQIGQHPRRGQSNYFRGGFSQVVLISLSFC